MLSFAGNRFNGATAPALRDLVERGLVRVVDLLFVTKDEDGTVGSIELAGLGADLEPGFRRPRRGSSAAGCSTRTTSRTWRPSSSSAARRPRCRRELWAVPFIEAGRAYGGELAVQFQVPSDVVAAVREAAQSV